jgi:hypothetical protein
MPENHNCPTNFDGSFPYKITTKSVKVFTEYMEKSIYDLGLH